MDQVDFTNTMATIGWSPASVIGFEPVAYGAALSLIHYQSGLTPLGRQGWVKSNNLLSDVGQVGVMKTKEGSFLSYINQLRLTTFGPGFDDRSVSHQPMLAITPWAQTDAQFQYSMNFINTGQIPDDKQFTEKFLNHDEHIVADNVASTLKKEAVKYMEKGAVAIGGGAVQLFFKVKKAAAGGLILDIVGNVVMDSIKQLQTKEVVGRFKTDEVRRRYLAEQGQSTYRVTS